MFDWAPRWLMYFCIGCVIAGSIGAWAGGKVSKAVIGYTEANQRIIDQHYENLTNALEEANVNVTITDENTPLGNPNQN